MSAHEALSPEQFPRRRYKVANSPSGYPAWVADVPVEHLVQHADPSRVTDTHSLRNVENIAASMRDRGYKPSTHHGFDHWGSKGYSEQAQPVHMTLQSGGGVELMNGNHRAYAAQRAGLSHLPVLITDFRSHQPGVPVPADRRTPT